MYPTVPNTFVESATAYATAVNANFAAVIAGISDGSKDLNVNDVAIAGSFTPAGAITVKTIMPAVDLTYNLGSAALRWNQVWTNSASVAGSAVVGTLNCTNTAIVNGNCQILTAASLNVWGTSNVSDVFPISNNAYQIGSTADRFTTIHAYYFQPGTKITFSSGVGFRFNASSNYLYYDASAHGMNGTVKVNDALEVGGTASIMGNMSLYNVVTFTGASATSWSATPTMLRHEIGGYGSGANQTVSFATGSLTSGAVVDLKYTAGAYYVRLQSDGPDVVLNAKRKHATYIKGDDESWRPLGMVPCSYVSDASGAGEVITQFNELIGTMRTMGMMLPS